MEGDGVRGYLAGGDLVEEVEPEVDGGEGFEVLADKGNHADLGDDGARGLVKRLDVDDDGVAGDDWFAEFVYVGRHDLV